MRVPFGLLALSILAWGQAVRVGGRIADFTLTDAHGQPVAISPGKGDVMVVMFISTICPVSNSYNVRINYLQRDYSPKGVKFVFINANQNESSTQVEAHARSAGFAFPVYRDKNNVVADRFGAQYTPETFVMDRSGVLRYHGRIDDAQNPARVQQHSLRMAIDAVLAGGEVAVPETKAFGCSIKRARRIS